MVVLILPAEARDDADDGDTELSPACAVSCWCRTAGLAGAERVSSPAPTAAPPQRYSWKRTFEICVGDPISHLLTVG